MVGDRALSKIEGGGLGGEHGMRRAPPEGMKIAITQNKQQRRREKGLSRQEAKRSRPVFLYIGLAADKPRDLNCERGGPGGRHSALTQQLRRRDEGRYEAVRHR